MLESPVPSDRVFCLLSGGDASDVGTVAISIGVSMTAKGGKPGSTSSERLVLDKDPGVDT